ncbi:MAG: DUF429 domain-containing protein [Gammaproteobacteria bacterium]|nr:DUF429 domain-containing protein [Gammaproteobacteria bacterium]
MIVRPTGEREWRVVPAVDELVRAAADGDRIFVDIPIGLPAGPKERVCDQVERLKLGRPRGSSVFRAPVREVLEAPSFAEAGKISREHTAIDGGEGKGVTKQTFAIIPKISEADKLMRICPKARGLVREIHPEVCFASLTGWRPMKHRKKTKAGFTERRAVLRMAWRDVDGLICDVLEKTLRKCVARDDILDAAVAALTACQDE